jgi:DNA-binding XRE family transcriptional regulator
MLAPTKKPHTETVLRFRGPKNKTDEAIRVLQEMGFSPEPETTSWQEAFPGLQENAPGTYLSGARHREELTQRQLAEKTGIPQRHVSEMENGKRPIGKETARKMAAVLKTDYRMFL